MSHGRIPTFRVRDTFKSKEQRAGILWDSKTGSERYSLLKDTKIGLSKHYHLSRKKWIDIEISYKKMIAGVILFDMGLMRR